MIGHEHAYFKGAGLTSDANILISYARLSAQRYRYAYDEPEPLEGLTQLLADYKHGYTQYGGLRPFGCSFLLAGWDSAYGYQLYSTDPSGNYSGWKATAIGNNSPTAISGLKTDMTDSITLEDAKKLAVKVLTKALDTAHPTSERIEVAVLTRDATSGLITQRPLKPEEVDALIALALPPETTATPSGTSAAI
jgi:20S proteasome subunit alpha 3